MVRNNRVQASENIDNGKNIILSDKEYSDSPYESEDETATVSVINHSTNTKSETKLMNPPTSSSPPIACESVNQAITRQFGEEMQ